MLGAASRISVAAIGPSISARVRGSYFLPGMAPGAAASCGAGEARPTDDMPALRDLRQPAALNNPSYRSIYAYIKRASKTAMQHVSTNPAACNCLALRQATRHVTQFYDQFISPLGLRATQYSILARLHRRGAMTINALAADLVMDRTTLGRNILPLQRDGLIAVGPGQADRRSKELRLTRAGLQRFAAAQKGWAKAQAQFERAYGTKRAKALRTLLEEVTARELSAA